VSEFGTRRRRAYWAQIQVIEGLIRANKELQSERQHPADGTTTGILTGTSNVSGFFGMLRARFDLLIGSFRAPLQPHACRDNRAVSVPLIEKNQELTRNTANGIWVLVDFPRF